MTDPGRRDIPPAGATGRHIPIGRPSTAAALDWVDRVMVPISRPTEAEAQDRADRAKADRAKAHQDRAARITKTEATKARLAADL